MTRGLRGFVAGFTLGLTAGLVALAAAQVPTAPSLRDAPPAGVTVQAPASGGGLAPLAPEVYSRDNVAPDMLQASIDALNAQTHEAAYRAALSEIREHLVKMRMATLIMLYKQHLIAAAQADLGLEAASLQDLDTQVRIHLHVLKMHGIDLALPELPPGLSASGLPVTPGQLWRSLAGRQP